jgi:hypothetical protein
MFAMSIFVESVYSILLNASMCGLYVTDRISAHVHNNILTCAPSLAALDGAAVLKYINVCTRVLHVASIHLPGSRRAQLPDRHHGVVCLAGTTPVCHPRIQPQVRHLGVVGHIGTNIDHRLHIQ